MSQYTRISLSFLRLTAGLIALMMLSFFGGRNFHVAHAAQTLTTAEYEDSNSDGQVDRIKLTFDENVAACAYEAEDWIINTAGDINVSAINSITGNCDNSDAFFYLNITADADITGGSTAPQIEYQNNGTLGSIQTASGNINTFANQAVADKAPPILQTIYYADFISGGDGIVDAIAPYYSESVTLTYDYTKWSLTKNNVAGMGSLNASAGCFDIGGGANSSCIDTDQPIIALDTTGAGKDTGADGGTQPQASYSGTTNIVDANSNQAATFSFVSMVDITPPTEGANNASFDAANLTYDTATGNVTLSGSNITAADSGENVIVELLIQASIGAGDDWDLTGTGFPGTSPLVQSNSGTPQSTISTGTVMNYTGAAAVKGNEIAYRLCDEISGIGARNCTSWSNNKNGVIVDVTDTNMSVTSTGSGTGGTYLAGDTLVIRWNNSISGDNNANVTTGTSTVTADLSNIGGSASVTMYEDDGTAGKDCGPTPSGADADYWCLSYDISGVGSVDVSDKTFAITVTDDNGNSDTEEDNDGGDAISVDTIAPAIAETDISILAGSTAKIGTVVDVAVATGASDIASVVFTSAASGDVLYDLDDAIDVAFNDSGTTPDSSGSDDTWSGRITVQGSAAVSGSADNASYGIEVTLTDDAGNTQTITSSTNTLNVDNIAPVIIDNGSLTITTDNGVASVAALNDGNTNQDKVTQSAVTLDSADGDTTTINLTDLTGQAALAAGVESGVVTAGSLDSATQTFTITVTDNAGNTANIASDAISVDNIAPTVTAARVTVTGCTGTGGVCKYGDTPTLRWDGSGAGDNESDTISSASFDGSNFKSGDSALVGADQGSNLWTASLSGAMDSQDDAGNQITVTVTDNAGNITGPTTSSGSYTIDTVVPSPTDGNITVTKTENAGAAGVANATDVMTVVWDAATDSDTDVASGSASFADFGGGSVALEDDGAGGNCDDTVAGDDIWCATYTVTAGTVDDTDNDVTLTLVTDDAGNVAGDVTDGTQFSVDNQDPTLTVGNISTVISNDDGDGRAEIGEIIKVAWDNSGSGDNNADLAGSNPVSVNFSEFEGGSVVADDDGTNCDDTGADNIWTACYTIASGTLVNDTNNDATVTVTDDAGNQSQQTDDADITVLNDTSAVDGTSSNIKLYDSNSNGKIDRIIFDVSNPSNNAWSLTGSLPYGLSVTSNSNDVTITGVTLTTGATADPVGIQVDLDENDADLTATTDGVGSNPIELIYTQDPTDRITDPDDELNTISTGDSGGTDTEADEAGPVITAAVLQDSDGDGDSDRIALTYSENLTNTTSGPNGFDVTSAANHGTCNAESADPDGTSTLNLNFACSTSYTAVGDINMAFTANAGVQDAGGNQSPGVTLTSASSPAISDGANPVLLSASYLDGNSDGTVETIRTTWSENVTMSGSTIDDWTIVGGNITAAFSAASDDASAGTALDVTVTADAGETGSVAVVSIAYDNDDANDSVQDEAANAAGSSAVVTATDGAAPQITSAAMSDNDNDGQVDRLTLAYTEALADTAAASNGFDVTSASNHGSCASESADPDGTSALVLSYSCDGVSTSVGDLTLAFTANTGVKDGSDNNAISQTLTSASSPAITDNASPVLVSWTLNLFSGVLGLNFSEAMDTSTLDVTKLTVQDAATATTSYTLTDSTSASGDVAAIDVTLSAADRNGLLADAGLAVSQATSYLTMVTTAIGDLAAKDVIGISDGSGVQASGYTDQVGALTAASASLASGTASASGTATVNFTLAQSLPANGKIQITFPAGFDVSGASSVSAQTNIDGTFAVGVAGQVVTLTRQNDGSSINANTAVSLTLSSVTNPSDSGTTGTFTYRTLTSGNVTLDENTAVTGVNITAAVVTYQCNDNADNDGDGLTDYPSDPGCSSATDDDETNAVTGGGGGGASVSRGAPGAPASTSNTSTSVIPSTVSKTVDKSKEYSRPLEVKKELIREDKEARIKSVRLTSEKGKIILKPNEKSTVQVEIPESTEVTGNDQWDGRIDPPVVKSKAYVSTKGEPIIGQKGFLKRSEVVTLIKVGSGKSSLAFSRPVRLTIPVDVPDGTEVEIFVSSDADRWLPLGRDNRATVKDGKVVAETDHFSFFAVREAVAHEAPEKKAALRPAAPVIERAVTRALSGFQDIRGHWAESYIETLYGLGAVSGKSETVFSPDAPVTRAEVVKIALKAFKVPVPPEVAAKPFADVPINTWYAPYAAVARARGIVPGFQGEFRPNEAITRAEALKILLLASGRSIRPAASVSFSDVNPRAWYAWYVRYAVGQGIVSGYPDGTFRPGSPITRAEAAKIAVRLSEP